MEETARRDGWVQVACDECSGHGQIAKYGTLSGDFEGPAECSICDGSGLLWQSRAGRLAKHPGGPFVGRAA